MAFTSVILSTENFGSKTVTIGSFTASGSETGGGITTGLSRVDAIFLQQTGAAVIADAPVADETFPLINSTDVTIVTTAGADGIWMAIGE